MDPQTGDNRVLNPPTVVLHLLPAPVVEALADRLERAGLAPGAGARRLEQLAAAGFALGALLVWALAASLGPLPAGASPVGWALVFGLAGAAALPVWWLGRAGEVHRKSLARQLPQVLDLLVVALEAGHGFDSALQQVTLVFRGPLVAELSRVLDRLLAGAALPVAMNELASRTGAPELEALATTVATSRQLGTPLANALRSQAAQIRQRRAQEAEEAARKVAVKILFPLAICIFPVLLTLLLGPVVVGMAAALKMLK
ncbi:MAG: type II secretion system F family protein [Candidatus Wallbacteria bacterium]|nr:type II secretion system F family protein [Candidatus Wallbacteria bacterium]